MSRSSDASLVSQKLFNIYHMHDISLERSFYNACANSNSDSNWTFIALNLPKQEDSNAQQNKKQSTKFCVQGHNWGRTPRRTPGG